MKNGVELIADERQLKQIEKHGFTAEHHAKNPQWYDKGQLMQAARILSLADGSYYLRQNIVPVNWDKEWFINLTQRPYMERLVIAGALLAAEIDRKLFLGEV